MKLIGTRPINYLHSVTFRTFGTFGEWQRK